MGIVDTIIRSKNDLVKPMKKNYWGYELHITLCDAAEIRKKVSLLPTEKRAVAHELSGIEPIDQVIILRNTRENLGRFTTNQIKEMLDDMGFNVDTILSGLHHADIAAVMNINGFIIPGWEILVRLIRKVRPSWEKLLLTKLAPGKERLHVRLFEMNDGTWLITAHTDWNWMSLNVVRVFRSHIIVGTGDYKTGTFIMYELLKMFHQRVKANTILTYEDIVHVTRWAYYQIMADRALNSLQGKKSV